MDIGFERFKTLFMGHAKALFLIDYHQPKPLKFQRFGQQCMGADDNIHCAIFQPVFGFARFFLRNKTR